MVKAGIKRPSLPPSRPPINNSSAEPRAEAPAALRALPPGTSLPSEPKQISFGFRLPRALLASLCFTSQVLSYDF